MFLYGCEHRGNRDGGASVLGGQTDESRKVIRHRIASWRPINIARVTLFSTAANRS